MVINHICGSKKSTWFLALVLYDFSALFDTSCCIPYLNSFFFLFWLFLFRLFYRATFFLPFINRILSLVPSPFLNLTDSFTLMISVIVSTWMTSKYNFLV